MGHTLALAVAAAAIALASARRGPDDPILDRVAELLANMTEADKLHQLLRP